MKKIVIIALSGLLALQCVGCSNSSQDSQAVVEEENYTSLLEHGNNLFKQKKYDKALVQYKKAYEKDNTDSQVYASLYKTYTMLKQGEEAEKVIKDAEMNLSKEEYQAFLTRIGKAKLEDENKELRFGQFVEIITTYKGVSLDYNNYFSPPADQECTIEFDDSKVDINKEGSYPLIVSLKPKKGKGLKKGATVVVEAQELEYTPGMYMSNFRMNIRTLPDVNADIVGSFAENVQVVVDQVVQGEDGSYWALFSTGYVCINDGNSEYLSFARPRVPVAADFNNDNNTFLDTVCPAVQGLGGYRSPDTFVGNVNRTISCDDTFLVY
ncbi:MAG: tetratricopeptide repeat protein [Firmicutes bacterium]|nr:tetratricopeptide repeat protein [Bacillota bacterium]